MDPETKKAAERCQIAGVGHVVASKPPLKPLVRQRTIERLPDDREYVVTPYGIGCWSERSQRFCYRMASHNMLPEWWAYLPEGDE